MARSMSAELEVTICDLKLVVLAMVLSLKWLGRAGRYLPGMQVGVPSSDRPGRGQGRPGGRGEPTFLVNAVFDVELHDLEELLGLGVALIRGLLKPLFGREVVSVARGEV